MMELTEQAGVTTLALAVADRLADPEKLAALCATRPGWRHSLAHGAPGIALLHVELAASEQRPWQRAHDWVSAAARGPITSGPDSHAFYGAPAVAHVVACAAEAQPGTYHRGLMAFDSAVAHDAQRRAEEGQRRIDRRGFPELREFDAIRGLAGYARYLLRRDRNAAVLRAVLEYLVRLTEPLTRHEETLPGWWASTAPSGRLDAERFPDGHANAGMAHGISGVLAVLALAARRGVVVDGHLDAIRTVCQWLDAWRTDTPTGPVWPYWVTQPENRPAVLAPSQPRRPSWCYGTPGVARALQLAGLALGDTDRQHQAEKALISALADPAQLDALRDPSLCHGHAGLAHVAARMADDARPDHERQLRTLLAPVLGDVAPPWLPPSIATETLSDLSVSGPGLLEGLAGIALAVLAPGTGIPPETDWDTCLLIA